MLRSWFKKMALRVLGYQELEEPDEVLEEFSPELSPEVFLEIHKRVIACETIEKGLASAVWKQRGVDEEIQSFRVTSVRGRTIEASAGQFWLFVELTERNNKRPPFEVVLHQFLEECQPIGDLTFYDWDA